MLLEALLCAIILTTSFFCAGQVAPSGGPPDTTPPVIVSAYPSHGALGYRDNRLNLVFNKYVDHSSVEGSLFISPSVGELNIAWSGTEVEIRFSNSLRPNTTYILTVGTDAVDTRKNRMASAFALPFSTGEHLDSASVSGKVFDTAPGGIMIFAYILGGQRGDTLNPTHTKPDYETQTGKDGSFVLTNLALGSYRVIAVRDEYRNLLYDRQTDEFGMATSDLLLDSARMKIAGIQFRMTKEDTTRPFLSSARPLDRSHLLLRFSEAMDTTGVRGSSISILDTATHESLPVRDLSFVDGSLLAAQAVTADQESSKTYRAALSGMKDLHGNPLNSLAGSGVFTGSPLADTSKPVIKLREIEEGGRNVPVDDSVEISFSEAIHPAGFEHAFQLRDTSNKPVAGSFRWWSSAQVSFIPSRALSLSTSYLVKVALDSVKDFSGNRAADTVWTRRFQTLEEKAVGSIKGKVVDDSAGAAGTIYVVASNIASRDVKPMNEVLSSPGAFVFERVLEGKYTIAGFRDSNGDGGYSFGMPFPYRPSERFDVFPDTLKVRARWPLEGVVLRFR